MTPSDTEPTAIATALIHHPYRPPVGFESPQPPVHRASTVIFPNTAAMRARNWREKSGYTYGLHGTPTTFLLEERIATLEGGRHTVLLPSGLAAIALVDQAVLKTGDEVLIPDNVYGPEPRAGAQRTCRLEHHASSLRPDGSRRARRDGHAGDPAGVARGAPAR